MLHFLLPRNPYFGSRPFGARLAKSDLAAHLRPVAREVFPGFLCYNKSERSINIITDKYNKLIMKIIKKLKWVFLVILIAVVGVLINENLVHYYTPKSVFYSILVGGIALTILTFFIRPARKYGIHKFLLCLTIGLLLIPYLSLMKGYSNMFAKDQAGVIAKEVRYKMVKMEFKKEGEDVWETVIANKEAVLYPGKNWVWLGKMEVSGVGHDWQRGITEIETDVIWDQNIISQEHPDWQVPMPESNPEVLKTEDLGEGKYFITFFYRIEEDRPILRPEGDVPPIPVYPDVGIDMVIGEDGRFLRSALHLLLPEPIGEKIIEVPLE